MKKPKKTRLKRLLLLTFLLWVEPACEAFRVEEKGKENDDEWRRTSMIFMREREPGLSFCPSRSKVKLFLTDYSCVQTKKPLAHFAEKKLGVNTPLLLSGICETRVRSRAMLSVKVVHKWNKNGPKSIFITAASYPHQTD